MFFRDPGLHLNFIGMDVPGLLKFLIFMWQSVQFDQKGTSWHPCATNEF